MQTYTLPYVKIIKEHLPAGSEIFLVTLEQAHLRMTDEAYRSEVDELARQGIHLIAFNYSRFGLKALVKWQLFLARLLILCLRRSITRIHAWCTPGGAAGYVLSKLTGIPLIIDSYEPHAEAMVENGAWRRDGLAYKLLFLLERLQSKHASVVIGTTRGMKAYARERYAADLKRFYAKPACVDVNDFSFAQVKNQSLLEQYDLSGKLVCVYAGKIGGIYLEREIFDFFKVASDYWGERFRVLLLTSASEARVKELAAASRLDPALIVSRFVPHALIPQHLGLGDFAINPVKPVPTKRFCTSIKDGEYWAMGLPVVITPDISDDSEIIERKRIGAVIRSLTMEGYLAAVKEIDELLKTRSRRELFDEIRAVALEYRSFSQAEKIYREIYGDAQAAELKNGEALEESQVL